MASQVEVVTTAKKSQKKKKKSKQDEESTPDVDSNVDLDVDEVVALGGDESDIVLLNEIDADKELVTDFSKNDNTSNELKSSWSDFYQ